MMKNTRTTDRTKSSIHPARRAVVRREDACPECGCLMKERRGRLVLPVNGENVTVLGATHLRCPKCREVVLRLDDARRLRRAALGIYRAKYGLLSEEDIRSIRDRFRLTQAELARLLRLGGNTISRWEAGRNIQTASLDVLLRLIRDLPGSLEYLRKHAA